MFIRAVFLSALATTGCGVQTDTPEPAGSTGQGTTTGGTSSADCDDDQRVQVFLDADSDGYGDPATGRLDCAASDGEALQAGDCNDHEPLAWTGAIDEPCDGVDNDCDGELPQCVRSMADGGGYIVGFDTEFRTIGGNVAFVGDMDGDGGEDIVVQGGWSDDQTSAMYLVSGQDLLGTTGHPIEPLVKASWSDPTKAWKPELAVVPTSDLTGDGIADLWLGTPLELVPGGMTGDLDRSVSVASIEVRVEHTAQGSGADVNGDGVPDVTIHNAEQHALVFHGPFVGTHLDEYQDPAVRVVIDEEVDFTDSVTVHDADADGVPELILGTDCAHGSGMAEPFFGIISGSYTGDLWEGEGATSRSNFDAWIDCWGDTRWDVGARLIGDFTGDGVGDLVVVDNYMHTYVVPGPFEGAIDVVASAVLVIQHDAPIDAIPDGVGDLDGDGLVEIITFDHGPIPGAEGTDGGVKDARRDGALYVIRGGRTGHISTSDADTAFYGQPSDNHSGMQVIAGGDVDGDGLKDVLIGAGNRYIPFETHAGHVYLLTGANLLEAAP